MGIGTVKTGAPSLSMHVLKKRASKMVFPTDAKAALSDRRKPQWPEPGVTWVGQTCDSSFWSLVVSVTLLWAVCIWRRNKTDRHKRLGG